MKSISPDDKLVKHLIDFYEGMAEIKTDGRKEAGERTRQRLLDAARTLLADRGEDAVTLRDITGSANANVAAVSYHFGSKDALCRAAIEQAIESGVQAQLERLRALDEDAGTDEIAAALACPIINELADPSDEGQAFQRVVARALTNPPPELREWMAHTNAVAQEELLRRLRRALPGVSDDELRFRAESVAGIMRCAVSGGMAMELHGRPVEELERLLIPVIAGALSGGAAVLR